MPHDLEVSLSPDTESVFAAPWQAEAFALTVTLSAAGWFTWPEWTDMFANELKTTAAVRGDADDGPIDYHEAWLIALEKLVEAKNIVDRERLLTRK